VGVQVYGWEAWAVDAAATLAAKTTNASAVFLRMISSLIFLNLATRELTLNRIKRRFGVQDSHTDILGSSNTWRASGDPVGWRILTF
jgi:hypothetical protein